MRLAAGAGLLALALYLLTAAPGITWRNGGIDSGELATAVATGSVAHPPGYPTYLLLGRLTLPLPVEPARSLAWLSALCAALTCAAAVHAAGRRSGGERWLVALAPGLWLMTAPLLWSSATYAEVNAPAAAVTALWLAARGWAPRPARPLLLAGALLGVSLGLHVLLGILAGGTALGQWRTPRAAVRLAALGGGLFFGAALVFGSLALFPAAGPVNWYAPQTAEGWLLLATADAYRGLLDPSGVPRGLLTMLRVVIENLGFVGAIAAVAGLQEVLTRTGRRVSDGTLRCGGLALLYVLFAAAYVARDAEAYLLPALVLLTPAAGTGLRLAATALLDGRSGSEATERKVGMRAGLAVIVLAPCLVNGLLHSGRLNLSDDREASEYATRVLGAAPRSAVLVTSGDAATFALWYARYARGERSDVAVVNEDLLPRAWYRAYLSRLHADLRLPADGGSGVTGADVAALNPTRPVLVAPSPDLGERR